jgi:hypothetical protein
VSADQQSPDADFIHRVETVLLERLDRIERENRRLRRFGNMMFVGLALVLGATAAVFWYSGRFGLAGGVPENLTAHQFTIRDEQGTTRGTWGLAEDGTIRFQLSDLRGTPRVRLSLLGDGSAGLSFSDTSDKKLVVIGALPDQSTSFVMSDHSGVPRAVLGMSSNGSSNLVFADRDGATKAGLGVDARGQGAFTLADRGGRAIDQSEPEPDSVDDVAPDSQPAATQKAPLQKATPLQKPARKQ